MLLPVYMFQEKRIYDLKKKNQELEKFKFVLDYKIKELKKQIEPRENDIKAMKAQIQEVSRSEFQLCLKSRWDHSPSLQLYLFMLLHRWRENWSLSTSRTHS